MEFNLFAILLSLAVSILRHFSTAVCALIANLGIFRHQNKEYKALCAEITKLKADQLLIDQINNFAEHALLQRKINKLQDQIDKHVDSHRKKVIKFQMYIKGAYNVALVIMSLILIWHSRDKPIVDFSSLVSHISNEATLMPSSNESVPLLNTTPKTTIFYPFDMLFAFPNLNRPNTIGVTAWLFITNRFLDIFLNKINFRSKVAVVKKQD